MTRNKSLAMPEMNTKIRDLKSDQLGFSNKKNFDQGLSCRIYKLKVAIGEKRGIINIDKYDLLILITKSVLQRRL